MVAQTRQPIEDHGVHSQRLIQHAEEQLANGDRLQASEKAWGAVAHSLKDIAGRRGWRYRTHAHVYDVAARLAEEQGQPDIQSLVSVATMLHQNYYEDLMPEGVIHHNIGQVKKMLEILRGC